MKVIAIGDYEFKHIEPRHKRLEENVCDHRRFILHDDEGDYVTCEDCGVQVSTFWALKKLVNMYRDAWSEILAARKQHNNQCGEKRWLRILNIIDDAWRGKQQMAVACPHCKAAILPEDNLGELQSSAKLERLRREKIKEEETR
jgi:hypothetical protein